MCSYKNIYLQRRGSLVGTNRPVNLTIRRSSSLRKGSRESLMKGSGEEEKRSYLTSRQSANRLSRSMSRQSSRSLDQLLYDSSELNITFTVCMNIRRDQKGS